MPFPVPCPVPRLPHADPASEEARVRAYWLWLANREGSPPPPAHVVLPLGTGETWVAIRTAEEADYEAAGMDHSIGHSWTKYSELGDVFGLRSRDGAPQVTILVSGGAVVHARERRNARLSPANEAALRTLAADRGWRIVPDRTAFDVFVDRPGGNTVLRYLRRRADGAADFKEVVLAGRPTSDAVEALTALCGEGREVAASALGVGDDDEDVHEIMMIGSTTDPATCGYGLDEVVERWRHHAPGPATRP